MVSKMEDEKRMLLGKFIDFRSDLRISHCTWMSINLKI